MPQQDRMIGRAKTALILRDDPDGRAVISAVAARSRRAKGRRRLRLHGPARFDTDTLEHVEDVLLPLVFRLLDRLHVNHRSLSFDLSVVNLSAASAKGAGLTIDGFSADAAVFLALLSIALKSPIPQEFVATGHIASLDGDIRAVEALPAKLTAAREHEGIRQFICPSHAADRSLQLLSEQEMEDAEGAIAEAKSRFRVLEVSDISQLVRAAWDDDALVRASLHNGFFDGETGLAATGGIIEQTAAHFVSGNEDRFWRLLKAALQEGRSPEASTLLADRVGFHIRRKRYPSGLGKRLFGVMLSIPPTVRQCRLTLPLVSTDACCTLGRFMQPTDHTDFRYLLDATSDRLVPHPEPVEPEPTFPASDHDAMATVRAVLSEIDPDTLAQRIGRPIDEARAGFVLDRVTTDSYEEFSGIVSSLYLTLVQHTKESDIPTQPELISAEAFNLLEQAFAREGGVAAAWANARQGTNGGLRFILDRVTDEFRSEQQSKHVNRIVKAAVDPLDWPRRVEFMRAFMEFLGPALSADVRQQPPERFARHCEVILHTYTQSLRSIKQIARRL